MTGVIFPQEKAGEFFNPRFVCVKFDMEKGEGKDLKKKLGVTAYPTFVIVRPDGTIQHRIVGGGELDDFIKKVETGLNEKTSLLYLTEKYNSGKMKKAELLAYYRALYDAYNNKLANKVAGELKAKLSKKDRLKAEYWSLFEMNRCTVGSEDFNFVLDNYSALVKNVGKEKIDKFIYMNYVDALMPYLMGSTPKNTLDVATLQKGIEGLQIVQKEILLNTCAIANIVIEKDAAKLVEMMEKQAETMAFENFVNFNTAQNTLKRQLTKEMFGRMAVATEKVKARAQSDEQKKYIDNVQDAFKKSAHVGVYFEDLTFEQALQKAKMTRRMLFVDCYTSWCGPCKHMTTKVFPQEKMGDYLNHFVCVKYNMEKGEGPELAKRFGVAAYPTFLIIDMDGNVRHKIVGGGEADYFIKRVGEAFDENKATGVLEAKYKAGNREHDFMVNYLKMLVATYANNADVVANELFQSLSDEEKVSEKYWFLYTNSKLSPKGSDSYNYLLNNHKKFVQSLGAEVVDKHFFYIYNARLTKILDDPLGSVKVDSVDRLKKEIVSLGLSNENVLLAKVNMARAFWSGNFTQLLSLAEKSVKFIPGEQFPVYLAYRVKDKVAPAQFKRWIKVCEAAIANCNDFKAANMIQGFVNVLKKK